MRTHTRTGKSVAAQSVLRHCVGYKSAESVRQKAIGVANAVRVNVAEYNDDNDQTTPQTSS